MAIWNQGDYYPALGESIVVFDHKIHIGPSDELIHMNGFKVSPNKNGHFLQTSDGNRYNENEMDAIRTFAISRKLINILEGILEEPLHWQWNLEGNSDPMQIYIRNCGINSRYLREQKCIELDYFGPYKNWTYYCRSVDIVAHETGHAILDGLKPGWYNANIETRGIAEAFCDFCAMLLVLTNKNLCNEVIKETDGNLKKTNILSLFGAGYGFNENVHSCIRNATNIKDYSLPLATVYDYGELLIGFLYDVLTNQVMHKITLGKNPSRCLFQSAIPWARAIVTSILKCNDEKTTIEEFIDHFRISFQNEDLINKSLKVRKLL